MKFKKPKFWDYKKPNFLSYLLLPLTLPLIINNFTLGFKNKTSHSQIKKICVGNIYVGGTGKTPLAIKIYKILNQLGYKAAVIKKYYKNHIDEQKILNANTKLYCFKNRVMALNEATKDNNDIAIFDDGLQDRSINYDLKFVCFNNTNWIGNGFLIPAGPLREKIESISKYDVVFINGNKLPWKFKVKKNVMDVNIGQVNRIEFEVENYGDETTYGVAAFNVSPSSFGKYYSKLGCFCFEKQALKAGEKATYIMTFYLDPEMVNDPNTKNIKDVTMSYTFFSSDYYTQSKL